MQIHGNRRILPFLLIILSYLYSTASSSTNSHPASQKEHLKPADHVSSNIIAAPLEKRYYVYSTDEIYAMIQKADVIRDRQAVFWTTFPYDGPIGQQGFMTARNWATQKFGGRCNFVLYNEALAPADYRLITNANQYDQPSTEQDMHRIQHMSKAFARSVKGTVWLLVMDGKRPHPSSVWSVYEFSIITRRGRVDQVIMVEYPSGRETVYWDKSEGVRGSPPPPGKV